MSIHVECNICRVVHLHGTIVTQVDHQLAHAPVILSQYKNTNIKPLKLELDENQEFVWCYPYEKRGDCGGRKLNGVMFLHLRLLFLFINSPCLNWDTLYNQFVAVKDVWLGLDGWLV